MKWSEF